MIRRAFLSLVSFSLLAVPVTGMGDGAAPEVWILSGQSNACGRAKLPGPEPHPRVTIFDPEQNTFVTAQDPLPNMGTTGTGPWVAAASLVATEADVAVRLCGFASGGKPIAYWHPGQPGHRGLFTAIEKAGQHADVFLWYQGENDTGGKLTMAGYRDELAAHVDRVRKACGNPTMLAVIIQVGPSLRDGRGGYMTIREAQRQFVIDDGHAVLVPALGRSMKDSVHLDNAGYRELGQEIGRAVLTVRHKKPTGSWPGPVLDAAVLRPEQSHRRNVVAHFAEVLNLRGAEAADFAVVDAEGTNRCVELQAGNTVVSLVCERDVVLPGRLVYGFGTHPRALLTDEAGNRAPAVQLPISLGDPPSDETTTAPTGAGRPRTGT